MAVSAPSVREALVAIAGRDEVVDDPAVLARAAVDGRSPRWLVRPRSTEQIAAVVALAHDERLAAVPRGSARAMELGFPPARVDILLDLVALNRIREWSPDDLTATVEAGVTAGALAECLAPRRQFLPLDPPGGDGRTLGGLAATNATGPLRVRYGGMRDLLLGVRFVQADGATTWGGAKVVKSVSGYDVPKLMVGALGTLGVLTELTLRLHPRPDVERTWLVALSPAERGQSLLASILDSVLQPSRVEWLNARALRRLGGPAGSAAVAVCLASAEAAVAAQAQLLAAFAQRAHATVSEVPAGWWDRYGDVFAADPLVLRVATLPSHLAATVAEVEARLPGCVIAGGAATGSLDVSLAAAADDLPRAIAALRAFLAPIGGHAMVTRAPAAVREALDPWGPVDEGSLAVMRAIKDEFDPDRVLNPGRFVGRL